MKALTLLIALLVLAAPASASTVRVTKNVEYDADDDFGRDDTETTTAIIRFRAAPGERNRVLVRRRGRRIVFRDSGARLQAGKRCTSTSMHRAVCRINFYADARFLSVGLGDRSDLALATRNVSLGASWFGRAGNDLIRGTAGGDYIKAGPGKDFAVGVGGRDQLLGGDGNDDLRGGEAADTLVDGPGRDAVRGGAGRDTVYSQDGPAAKRDLLRGGEDRDRVSYSRRRAAVTATLGGAGEDRLRGFEVLAGGDGDDTLTGDDAPNRLDGGDGADRLVGLGANDRFVVSDGDADHALCGDGTDTVTETFAVEYLVEPDCELVWPYALGPLSGNPATTTADTVTVRVPCARADATPAQRLLELRIPAAESAWYTGGGLDSVVGTGEVPVGDPTQRCSGEIALNDAGRALGRPVPLRLSVGTTGWHFQLR